MSEFKYDDGLPDLRPGEPFFFLRAQDVLAPFAVQAYAAQLRAAAAGMVHAPGGSIASNATARELREMADDAERRAAQMVAWQSQHRAKLPD